MADREMMSRAPAVGLSAGLPATVLSSQAMLSPYMSWFATLVMVLSTGAFVTVFLDAANAAVLGVWVLAYLVAAAMLFDGLIRERMTVRLPVALVVFMGLAASSVIWSTAPDITVRRSIGLIGTVIIGLVLAQRLTPIDILDAARRAMLIIAVISLLFYFSGDPRAIDEVHGTLRGIVATKNTLGRVMGLGLVAAAATAYIDPNRMRRAVWSTVPMVLALALTGSAGGGIIAVLVLILLSAALLWRAAAGRILLAGAGALATGAAVVLTPATSAEDIVGLVGRDLTITGRTDIWSLSLDALADRLLLGYGYGTFWHEAGPTAGRRIVALLYWPVPSAHNGLLDVALDVGLAGVLLALLILGGLLVSGVRDASEGRRQVAVFRIWVGLLVLFSNIAESSFLQENAFLTIVFVAAIAAREPDAMPGSASRGPD